MCCCYPTQIELALRGVDAGFNLIIALAVFLYGRQVGTKSLRQRAALTLIVQRFGISWIRA